MKEIQVEEYVRTNDGIIKKIKEINTNIVTVGHGMQEIEYYCKFDIGNIIFAETYRELEEKINKVIKKKSFDITDLVEKDDYINGCRVYEVEEKGITVYQKVEDSSVDYNWIAKDEVETIWTKEQLKTIEYNVN